MRVFEDMKFLQSIKMELDSFNSLPERAKELVFNFVNYYCDNNDFYKFVLISSMFGGVECCKSPIEIIFMVAFNIVSTERLSFINNNLTLYINNQYKIKCGKSNNYYVDFMIGFFDTDNDNEEIGKQLVIECDGHDFHKANKQQIKKDNERELDIKMAGYEVIRFSGTQIYENPIKCANDAIDYLIKIQEGVIEVGNL